MTEARKIRPNAVRDVIGVLGLALIAVGAWGLWGASVACLVVGSVLLGLVIAGARGR